MAMLRHEVTKEILALQEEITQITEGRVSFRRHGVKYGFRKNSLFLNTNGTAERNNLSWNEQNEMRKSNTSLISCKIGLPGLPQIKIDFD